MENTFFQRSPIPSAMFDSKIVRTVQAVRHGSLFTLSSGWHWSKPRTLPQGTCFALAWRQSEGITHLPSASTASGLDNIAPHLMKDAPKVIASPLTGIINVSLSEGVGPQEWKCARKSDKTRHGQLPSHCRSTCRLKSTRNGCLPATLQLPKPT